MAVGRVRWLRLGLSSGFDELEDMFASAAWTLSIRRSRSSMRRPPRQRSLSACAQIGKRTHLLADDVNDHVSVTLKHSLDEVAALHLVVLSSKSLSQILCQSLLLDNGALESGLWRMR